MEDAQLAPPMPTSEPATIPTLDGWIESLMSCKQLAEADVQRLCEKVSEPAPKATCPALSLPLFHASLLTRLT